LEIGVNTPEELRHRTKEFSLRVIRLCRPIRWQDDAHVIAKQLLRSATSIGANYRAACRARSRNEFYSKLCIVAEEADETVYWLELLDEGGLLPHAKLDGVLREAKELAAIFTASKATMADRLPAPSMR
jgi:four helix bundle protein